MRYFDGKAGLLEAIFNESWRSLRERAAESTSRFSFLTSIGRRGEERAESRSFPVTSRSRTIASALQIS